MNSTSQWDVLVYSLMLFLVILLAFSLVSNLIEKNSYDDECVEAKAKDICAEMDAIYSGYSKGSKEFTAECLKSRSYHAKYIFTEDEKASCKR